MLGNGGGGLLGEVRGGRFGVVSRRGAVWPRTYRRAAHRRAEARSAAAINICGDLLLVGYAVRHFDLQANRAPTLIIYLVACYD